jgi:hypothetical protein
VCGFSGVVLSTVNGTVNSSFNERMGVLDAMRSFRRVTSYRQTGIRSGLKMARSLERRAILSASHITRNSMFRQARDARKRKKQHQKTQQFEKSVLIQNTLRYLPKVNNDTPPPNPGYGSVGPQGEELAWFEAMIAEHKKKSDMELAQEAAENEQRKALLAAMQLLPRELSDIEGEEEDGEDDKENTGDDDAMDVPPPQGDEVEDIFYDDAPLYDREVDDDGAGGGGDWEQLHDDEERRHARLTARGVLDPTWYMPVVVIPDLEMRTDDEYLRGWLDPVADSVEELDFSIFHPRWVQPPLPTTRTQDPGYVQGSPTESSSSSSGSHRPRKPRQTGSLTRRGRRGRRVRTPWFVLHPEMELRDCLPHQRVIRDYVDRFLLHYIPLTQPGLCKHIPEVNAVRQQYALFCDRLLWAYHYDTGMTGGLLWPLDPKSRLDTVLFAILTTVLTKPGYARDPVTQAKIPVWLGCPWLAAMSNAGHFRPARIPSTLLTRANVNLENYRDPLLSILRCTSFSPHTLSSFLLPPARAETPGYVFERYTDVLPAVPQPNVRIVLFR